MNQKDNSTLNTKDSKRIRIYIDKDLCIGAASCISIAPSTFKLDENAKAYVYADEIDDYDTILEAAMSCPTLAIVLKDDNGNQIWP